MTQYLKSEPFFGHVGLIKQVETHREVEQRGSHVTIHHVNRYRTHLALIEDMNATPDFREPDNIHPGLTSMYTSFRMYGKMLTVFNV